MTEYENYLRFPNLSKQVQFSERSWDDLTEEEILRLQNIAEANTGRSSTMAKGVLCFFYEIYHEDDIEIIEENETPMTKIKNFDTQTNDYNSIY